jgi:acetyltransferase-like isoleucine patch superfamily enzyme
MSARADRLRQIVKQALDGLCLVLVAPCAWSCAIDRRSHGETVFVTWAQCFAIVPGPPGVFLRRAFYRLTLARCSGSFFIGFGAMCSHRHTEIEDGVYVGPYAMVGTARLRRGCLIGSRAGIISGSALHTFDASGRRTPTDLRQLRQVEIGADAWIGEAALVMADVGKGATVAAGAVVSSAVMRGVVVAGNPARFIKRVPMPGDEAEGHISAAM